MVGVSGQGALAEARSLVASGVRRTFIERGALLDLAPPSYMRSIDDEITAMLALPDEFPGLVRADVIGRSVEGRPLVALHLTNFDDARPKPLVGLEWNIHGDEIANGPLGMDLVRTMLRGYGRDPDATAILDSRELRVIPFANPDGRARIELGYLTGNVDDLFFRTNANGVDLNRNFPYAWSATTARRGSAGAAPMDQPETKALVEYWRRHTPKAFVAGHSKGDTILVPFGHTPEPPKDAEALGRIAAGLAERNGYRVASSRDFTRGGTSGTSKDWMYGELGVPSYTFEVGTRHHMSQAAFEQAIERNRPAMSWLARIADDPELRSRGPAVTSALRQAEGGVEALVRPDGARRPIVAVELYGDPLAAAGTGVRLHAVGSGDAVDSTRWLLDPAGVETLQDVRNGIRYVRAMDDAGTWGPFAAVGPST